MTIGTQRLRFLRGNTAAASAFTGLGGELIVDTTLNTIRVQDGYTPGGTLLATAASLANVSIDQLTNGSYSLVLDTNGDAIIPGNLVSANATLTSYVDLHKDGLGGIEAGAYTDFTILTDLSGGINEWYFGTDGNLTIPGNINYANGISILSGITANGGGNYSNANVASYLPTYSGNVNAAYFTGNGALLTGIAASSNYGNTNVAAYLPVYGGTVNSNKIINTGDVNLISESFVQVQYDPSGNYDPYTLGDGSWFYLGSPGVGGGLVFESNLTGNIHAVRFNDLGNIAADGSITFDGNLINGASNWNFGSDGKLTAPGEVYGQFYTIRGGNGPGAEIGSLGYGGNVVTVHGTEGFNIETGAVESGPQWQFGTDGNLTLPGNITLPGKINFTHGQQVYTSGNGTNNNFITVTANIRNDINGFQVGESTAGALLYTSGNIRLIADSADTEQTWTFGTDGSFLLPSNPSIYAVDHSTVTMDYVGMTALNVAQITGVNGGDHLTIAVPSGRFWTFGANGSTTLPGGITGNIATFDNLYGQIGTAAQPIITSLGTLTGLAVSGTVSTGGLQVNGNATIGNLLVTGTSTIIGNINMISGNSGQFFGNSPTGFNALYTGIAAGYTPLQQTIIQSSGNYNDYVQINLENVNSGNAATGDYVVTADNGTDTSYYIDMGIASSNFDGLSPNIVGNSVRANDAYLYTLGNGAGNQGGNLIIGAGTEGKVVKIIAGGGHTHDVIAQISSSLLQVFGSTTANGNVTTGSYFIGNGSQLTGVNAVTATSAIYVTGLTSANVTTALGFVPANSNAASNYGNANVAAYLPTYTGNISAANISLTNNTSALTFNTGAYIYGDTVSRPGSVVLQPNTSVAGFPSVIVGGAGRLAAPNGSVHVIFNSNDLTVQVPLKATSGTVSTSTTTGALQVTGGAGLTGNIFASGNISGNYFIGNGALLTGITASSNYGNTNVTAFLGAYGSNTIVTTGNISAGYFVGNGSLLTGIVASGSTYANSNVAAYLASNSAVPITTTSNITAAYYIGNGSLLTGIVANTTYSNTNVASYLTGNIVVGNISGNEPNVTLVANTYSYVFSNIGNVSFPGNLSVTSNVSGNYFIGNGALLTGIVASGSSYGNTNVAAYLPTYSGNLGNITVTDIQTTATKIHLGSNAGITSQGSYSVAIGTQAGETSQSFKSVSIGYQAAQSSQLDSAVAIGNQAGQTSQSSGGVAIGWQAGQTSQSGGAVAIGTFAGLGNQGSYSVALGMYAGSTNQANNSIILNASGSEFNAAASGFYVNPIRSNASLGNILYFNTVTNEITYGASPAAGNYSNANVASYLPTYTGNIAADNINFNGASGGIVQTPNSDFSVLVQDDNNDDYAIYNRVSGAGTTLGETRLRRGDFEINFPNASKNFNFNDNGILGLPGDISLNTQGGDISLYAIDNGSTGSAEIKTISYAGATLGSNVRVTQNNATISTANAAHTWTFSNTGVLTVPGTITNGNGATMSFGTNNARIDVGNGTTYIDIQDQDLFLISNTIVISSNGNTWDFAANGNIILPSNSSAILYPNGASILSGITGSSNYSNSNVASFLGAYGSNTIVTTGNISAGYFVGNGSLLTGITATANYNNANVASFLSSYGSNTIVTTGNISAGYFIGDGSLLTGITATANYNNSNVASFLASFGTNAISTTGNITAGNIIANQFGNSVGTTATYTGNVTVGNLSISGNIVDTGPLSIISGSNGNISLIPNGTGIVTAPGALTAFGNVVTAYATQANASTLFIGNNTTISAGGASASSTYVMNNAYYNTAGVLTARNTLAAGAGQFEIAGGTFNWNATGSATANSAAGMGARMSLNSTALSTQNSIGITSAGTLTVQGASGLVTTQTTGALFNTTATTINLGGVATTINMGAATTVVNVGSNTGNISVGNISTNTNITVNSTITTGTLTLAAAGTGNISGVGNIVGITSNTTITAGTYVTSFLSNGAVTTTGNIIVTGSNAVSVPNLPAFRVYGNTSTQYTGGTTITNQVVDYNQGSYYNNATGIFTAPVPGIYHAVATLRVGTNNGLNQASLQKNSSGSGANVIAFWETDTNIGTATHFTMSGYAKLIAGDTIRLQVITGNVNLDSNDSWSVTFVG